MEIRFNPQKMHKKRDSTHVICDMGMDLTEYVVLNRIKHIIDTYGLTQNMVAQYIMEVSLGSNDSRVFKFLQAPLKFEFLISLYLYLCLGDNYDYRPNYLCDEAGSPYSHAPGNIGDIEVYNTERYWLIEVTLIKGKNQQINNETINLFRHITTVH